MKILPDKPELSSICTTSTIVTAIDTECKQHQEAHAKKLNQSALEHAYTYYSHTELVFILCIKQNVHVSSLPQKQGGNRMNAPCHQAWRTTLEECMNRPGRTPSALALVSELLHIHCACLLASEVSQSKLLLGRETIQITKTGFSIIFTARREFTNGQLTRTEGM
jgi:hypothetical protein